ncbi:pentapeptide repeat-containing protein [Brasilonema sp. CT11]|nr:pentapeptide repeat-containing protein [Brasilonema sp. CT11]
MFSLQLRDVPRQLLSKSDSRSFKGQNLAGANLSYVDIRGTDFRGANLN